MAAEAIRVAVVDDHEMFRDGLRSVLGATPGFTLAFEAGDARSFLEQVDRPVDFDVALVDIAMPGTNGFSLLRELRRRRQPQPTILLTMHLEADMVVEGFSAGAHGYVFKSQPVRAIFPAIREVLAGRRHLPPDFDEATLSGRLKRRGEAASVSPLAILSPREHEVFDLLTRGFTNRSIAKQLFISVKTVESHREHILKKLGAHSVVDLVRLAARHNLLSPTSEASHSSSR